MLASQWERISQHEALIGRTSAVGDEAGSKILAAAMARLLMEIGFLMERRYWPYGKWFGKAFSRLRIANKLGPILAEILDADEYREREKWLAEAYRVVAQKQNSLGITDSPISAKASRYYDRPYMVIHAERFAKKLHDRIESSNIGGLPLMGSIDQVVGDADLLGRRERSKIETLYGKDRIASR